MGSFPASQSRGTSVRGPSPDFVVVGGEIVLVESPAESAAQKFVEVRGRAAAGALDVHELSDDGVSHGSRHLVEMILDGIVHQMAALQGDDGVTHGSAEIALPVEKRPEPIQHVGTGGIEDVAAHGMEEDIADAFAADKPPLGAPLFRIR
ncbi:MAG: hypothetical protein LUE08_05025 [Akkermansiaceae bacterium]|nr:hypothetical protein [Akkermansiaceae bacterium]